MKKLMLGMEGKWKQERVPTRGRGGEKIRKEEGGRNADRVTKDKRREQKSRENERKTKKGEEISSSIQDVLP